MIYHLSICCQSDEDGFPGSLLNINDSCKPSLWQYPLWKVLYRSNWIEIELERTSPFTVTECEGAASADLSSRACRSPAHLSLTLHRLLRRFYCGKKISFVMFLHSSVKIWNFRKDFHLTFSSVSHLLFLLTSLGGTPQSDSLCFTDCWMKKIKCSFPEFLCFFRHLLCCEAFMITDGELWLY